MEREEPQGLRYAAEFLTPDEEQALLAWMETLAFDEVVLHGRAARRTVRHYGYSYDYASGGVVPGEPLPAELRAMRDRAAGLAELPPEAFAEALVTRYPPGATIGWHRDAPVFGSRVVGVSLRSGCRLRFQRGKGDQRRVHDLAVAPRSAYLLSGAARSSWQHSIPPVPELRYSVTFRTLRTAAAAPGR
jgi:alkylated DNA repair dioxygenase AlkB